jgi:Protein of unknown function (DUF3592)
VKAMKILGVVFGILLLLTGIGLLTGSAVVGATQEAIEDELAKQGLSGPVKGTVTSVGQGVFTVSYTDKQGTAQTGTGPVVSGTEPPSVGDEVSVYYNTADPSSIAIFDLPGDADFGGLARTLRTAGIVCLIVGAVLLLAGIIGLVAGRKARAAVTAGPAGVPQPVPAGQPEPGPGQQYPPQPGPQNPSGEQQVPPTQPYPPSS